MTVLLSPRVTQEIEQWLGKFPKDKRQSAVIAALKIVQEDNGGFLTESLMDAVAAYLRIPKIAVYEVASFYSMFELQPIGKHKIEVCTNIVCLLRGCENIVEHIKNRLNIDFNETTEDGRFTLKSVECLAACNGAPAMYIGNQYYENLNPEAVDKILAELR